MTVDRFVEDRRARWARLGNLIAEANGRVERLAPNDVLELGRLYRSASSDLAVARRDFALDAATERLNDLVAGAHALVYSEAPTSGRRLRRFVLHELPASVRANSRYTAISIAAFVIPLLATFAIGLLFPEIAATALPADTRQHLAERRLDRHPRGVSPARGPAHHREQRPRRPRRVRRRAHRRRAHALRPGRERRLPGHGSRRRAGLRPLRRPPCVHRRARSARALLHHPLPRR